MHRKFTRYLHEGMIVHFTINTFYTIIDIPIDWISCNKPF